MPGMCRILRTTTTAYCTKDTAKAPQTMATESALFSRGDRAPLSKGNTNKPVYEAHARVPA